MRNIEFRSNIIILLISLCLVLSLLLTQILESLQKQTSILLAIKFILNYTVFQALMIYKMPTRQSSKENHSCGSTFEAFNILWIKIHFFKRINMITDIPRDVGIARRDIVKQFSRILLDFSDFLQHLVIECLFSFTLYVVFYLQLTLPPLLSTSPSAICVLFDKWMLDMLVTAVASLTQFKRCTQNTFMRIFRYCFNSTAGATKLKFDFLTLLFGKLFLLLLNFLKIALWKFASTHWTTYPTIFLGSMFRPYLQAFQMKIISTFHFTITQAHIITHGLLTNRANRILLQFHSLRKYHYFYLLFLLFSRHIFTRKLKTNCFLEILECWAWPPYQGNCMLTSNKI